MEKRKLLFIPFSIGLILFIWSWLSSYPIITNPGNDLAFNHLSSIYWISLTILFPTMYAIAVTFHNSTIKWVMVVGIVLALYSTTFFYYRLSTSDAHFYRGLHEYFSKTGNLDSSLSGKAYLQWPAIFILNNIALSISGLQLRFFEFFMFAIIGFLLVTALYIYVSKKFKQGGFLAVIGFFIAMFYYLNYQYAAFTIAFLFLLVALALEGEKWTSSKLIIILVLFAGMTLSHAYVAVFYIIFVGIKTVLGRDAQYRNLFFITLTFYLLYQLTLTNNAIDSYIMQLTQLDTNISWMAGLSVTPVTILIDVISQRILTVELLLTVSICGLGFLLLLLRRKTRNFDIAILLTGLGYFVFGMAFWVLGPRAIPLAFIPISMGASYLFETKFKKYVVGIFLIVMILLVFLPIHNSFYKQYEFSQTEEAYDAEQFMLKNYYWVNGGIILAHSPVTEYIRSSLGYKESAGTYLESDESASFPRFNEYSGIIYTIGLQDRLSQALNSNNSTLKEMMYNESLSVVYNNGFSDLMIKTQNFK